MEGLGVTCLISFLVSIATVVLFALTALFSLGLDRGVSQWWILFLTIVSFISWILFLITGGILVFNLVIPFLQEDK